MKNIQLSYFVSPDHKNQIRAHIHTTTFKRCQISTRLQTSLTVCEHRPTCGISLLTGVEIIFQFELSHLRASVCSQIFTLIFGDLEVLESAVVELDISMFLA